MNGLTCERRTLRTLPSGIADRARVNHRTDPKTRPHREP